MIYIQKMIHKYNEQYNYDKIHFIYVYHFLCVQITSQIDFTMHHLIVTCTELGLLC